MALLKIRTYPDRVLTKKSAPVTKFDAKLRDLVQDMIETMYAEDGVGLAAPQVGVSKQIVVVSPDARPGEERILINPAILKRSSDKELGIEGCLSLPGLTAEVPRARSITFKAKTLEGKEQTEQAEGFPARVIQHEVDHLNGILLSHYIKEVHPSSSPGATYRRL